MVQKFDTASSGDNQIPDNINSNGVASNNYGYSADPHSMMNVPMTKPASAAPAYVPAQTSKNASWWGRLSLATKATVLAVAISTLPVLGIGVIDYVVVNQTQQQEIGSAKPIKNPSYLLLVTGATALLAGTVAAILAKRAVAPILAAANAVQKLGQGKLDTRLAMDGDDELTALGFNINRMAEQVQTLLDEQKASVEQLRTYAETVNAATRGDKQFLFDRAVQEAKKQLKADRVVIYGFEPDWSGSIVAEAVDPGWPRALLDKITDPCIPRKTLEEYRKGRVVPTSNVQQTHYSPAHLQLLARLSVKANLVVPIISGELLIGLLVAHQCSNTRVWQPSEIDFLKELAAQVGLSLSSITLATSKAAEAERIQRWKDIIPRIRQSLEAREILDTTVAAVREALHTDRVLIYRFDDGTFAAESTAPGWSKVRGQTFKKEGTIAEEYRSGQVRTGDNIDGASPSDWEYAMLELLSVKAYMMAPIIKEGKVYGLLCAYQCSKPRIWLDAEIDLFSQIADQIGFALLQAALLEQQGIATELAQQLNAITSRIRESLKVEEIYNAAIIGIRETLNTDRAIVYLFDENWQGTIVAESVGRDWPPSLGANIADPCFADQYVEKYKRGRVKAVENIYDAGLTKCYLGQLEPFKVKANLVAPILAEGNLLGLLVTHQCSSTRAWQESEITFFKQVATQIGFALDQANLLEQREQARIAAELASQEQRQQKESLQLQLLELLSDVEGAARGDLTVRADVTVGEIGTVADFFNAVIESLRGIVTQVKAAATQVNTSLGENEGAIRQLSLEALKQAEETTRTLDSVEQMTRSIQQVAENARQAAAVARTASTTAEAGGLAMDRSVQNILNLRETVAGTAKKVKRLGESSQQISKVVSLINQIALQTNLLAINAGIEAARAGEEGQGFAVVAEEVGELAARSAAATREIEQIVENIQQETASVVEAMELGTSQVVEGTHLVEDAKQSLNQILEVSRQIDQLVQSISTATVSQAETSQAITELMKDIARISESTSNSTLQVASSLQETVGIAEELQASVGTFKVGD